MGRDAVATYLESEPAAEWPILGDTIVAEVDVPIVETGARLRADATTASNAA